MTSLMPIIQFVANMRCRAGVTCLGPVWPRLRHCEVCASMCNTNDEPESLHYGKQTQSISTALRWSECKPGDVKRSHRPPRKTIIGEGACLGLTRRGPGPIRVHVGAARSGAELVSCTELVVGEVRDTRARFRMPQYLVSRVVLNHYSCYLSD